MCEDCFSTQVYKFPSQVDFEHFEDILQQKCSTKKIIINDIEDSNSLEVLDSRLYYTCANCEENWVMSIPDNAWRGYFLTESKAIEYHEKLRAEDKKRSIGCWIFLLLIVLVAIWMAIK